MHRNAFAIQKSTIVVSLLLMLVMASAVAAQDRPGFPAIVVEPDSLDFGRMDQQEVRTKSVIIRNVGGAPLEILDVGTTCGCTVAKPDVDVLAPGESTEMLVTFDSKTFTGPQTKSVKITSNDPAEPELTFKVTSYVFAPLVFIPQWKVVGFGRERASEMKSQVVKVVASEEDFLNLEISRLNENLLDVRFEQKPDRPNEQNITFTVKESAPPGVFREIVSFKTNVVDAPTFDIEATGDIFSEVTLNPERYNFRYVTRDESMTQTFYLQKPRHMPLKISRAEIDLPGFEVSEVKLSDHTGHFEITLTGTPLPTSDPRAQAANGRMSGTLKVTTSDPELPVFESTVMYMLKL